MVASTDPKTKIYNGICHEFTVYCLWKSGYITKARGDGIIETWAGINDMNKYGATLPIKANGVRVHRADMPLVAGEAGWILGYYGADWLGHSMQSAGSGWLGGVNNAGVMPVDTAWNCRSHDELLWKGDTVGANGYEVYKVAPETLVGAM